MTEYEYKPDVFVNTQEYSVCCLTMDHPSWRYYRIRVVRIGQQWMVWDGMQYADEAGDWDYRPAESDDLWWKRHRFSRALALDIATRLAPTMECNGRVVTDLI